MIAHRWPPFLRGFTSLDRLFCSCARPLAASQSHQQARTLFSVSCGRSLDGWFDTCFSGRWAKACSLELLCLGHLDALRGIRWLSPWSTPCRIANLCPARWSGFRRASWCAMLHRAHLWLDWRPVSHWLRMIRHFCLLHLASYFRQKQRTFIPQRLSSGLTQSVELHQVVARQPS